MCLQLKIFIDVPMYRFARNTKHRGRSGHIVLCELREVSVRIPPDRASCRPAMIASIAKGGGKRIIKFFQIG
jgi:hypothetical protein